MKFKYIKQHYEIMMAAFAFAIVIFIYVRTDFNNNLFLGALGIIATFYFGVLKYKIENDRVFQELFTSFNDRYNSDFTKLINSLRGHPDKILEVHNEKSDESLIIEYFNLCAEEYLWYSKNRIPKSIWGAWKAGIKENLEIKQVREVYDKETKTERGRKSYYGLVEELGG